LLADEPGQAWLRLWARALVLAFLTGRPVPGVPGPLRLLASRARPGRRSARAGANACWPR